MEIRNKLQIHFSTFVGNTTKTVKIPIGIINKKW